MQSATTTTGAVVATDETDRLISSDKVVGTAVYNRQGERLGSVYGLMIDKYTGQLATSSCPETRNQVFISGTQPVEACRLHGSGRTQIAGWESSRPTPVPQPVVAPERSPVVASIPQNAERKPARSIPVTPAPPPQPEKKDQRKGFFGRIRDMFK